MAKEVGSSSAKSVGSGLMTQSSQTQLGCEAQESNEDLERDSCAGQQIGMCLGAIGGSQGGETSVMAGKRKERSVDVPNDNPCSKLGDRVEATFTKSKKYRPGKIGVAHGSNGQYGTTFDGSDEVEVQRSHLRSTTKPVTNISKPSRFSEKTHIRNFCCPACKYTKVPQFIFFVI